jgi:hypothetical protein
MKYSNKSLISRILPAGAVPDASTISAQGSIVLDADRDGPGRRGTIVRWRNRPEARIVDEEINIGRKAVRCLEENDTGSIQFPVTGIAINHDPII